jgi:hypothetical protein
LGGASKTGFFSISHQGAKVSTTIVAVNTLALWVALQQTVILFAMRYPRSQGKYRHDCHTNPGSLGDGVTTNCFSACYRLTKEPRQAQPCLLYLTWLFGWCYNKLFYLL